MSTQGQIKILEEVFSYRGIARGAANRGIR